MFLLVSGRHVGAHTDGHQHGVSIQISINLGKKFLRASRIRKIAVIRILARVFAYLPSFISQILDFIYRPVLIFILIYFELRDTENQQLTAVKTRYPLPISSDHIAGSDQELVAVACFLELTACQVLGCLIRSRAQARFLIRCKLTPAALLTFLLTYSLNNRFWKVPDILRT